MEFTNRLNLPQYIVDWLENDTYDHNDDPYTISATTLMKPTRAFILTSRHKNKLQSDVCDLIASRVGSALHDSIENIETSGVQKEYRASKEVNMGSVTYTVTGKYDILEENEDGTYTLRDIKTTSVWSYILGGKDEDYQKQLSIYRWLLSDDKEVRDKAYIDFFFTDWSRAKSRTDAQYPNYRIQPGYEIQLMSLEETEEWIKSRLQLVEDNKLLSDEDLIECTQTELWATPEKFAVMKKGGKRASKVCDSQRDAYAYMNGKGIKGYIQRRPPQIKRCNYCSAFPYCNQGQSYNDKGLLA